ncbi:MAG TPA: ABC-type transport auxiliary lipoprotein family protein [Burkholderiaceae bacterium]|nr:ABC-type transport auxiliary lipoprotein family protein [Burkholderiaceae bacterium]
MRGPVIVLATWLIAGCASSDQPHRYFILDGGATRAREPATTAPSPHGTVLVAPVTAAGFYGTREIAYSRVAGTRGYYQYSNWTELPAIAIGNALMPKLERSGRFRMVVHAASRVDGTLVLRVHLDELYHDAATPPGIARVALTAQLSDPSTRALVDRRTFAAAAPAKSYDADGAVAGLRQALDHALDDLVSWVAAAQR